MAINKVEMFGVSCDNCDENYHDDNTGFTCMNDEESIWDMANNDGWTIDEESKLYLCVKCYKIDDDDNIVINHERTKNPI